MSIKPKQVGSFFNDVTEAAMKSFKGQKITNNSRQAIVSNFTGGLEYLGRGLRNNDFGTTNLKKTFGNLTDDMLDASGKIKQEELKNFKWNPGKIAGSYIAASGVARLATGGGVYKDGNGNTNIAAVPFV